MKRFCILLSLVMVLGVISGCSPADTTTATSAQTSTPAPSETQTTTPPSITQTPTPSQSKTPTPSSTTSATQTLTPSPSKTQTTSPAPSETQTQTIIPPPQNYEVFTKTTINKTSFIIGENLTIQTELQYMGNEFSLLGTPIIIIWSSNWLIVACWYLDQQGNVVSGVPSTFFQIEKGKNYFMNVTWDLRQMDTKINLPPGKYNIQRTISIGNHLLSSSEWGLLITIS